MKIELGCEEIGVVLAALDDRVYWQLSDPKYRHSGEVFDPERPSEDVISDNPSQQSEGLRCRRLVEKLEKARGGG